MGAIATPAFLLAGLRRRTEASQRHHRVSEHMIAMRVVAGAT
jgi:hypothetical protein